MSDKLDLTRGTVRPGTFRVASRLLRGLCRALFGLRVQGRENIPVDGPFILVGNHLHNLDPVFMEIASTRLIFFIAKEELFRVPVVRQIIRWAGAFPVKRGQMDRSAIRQAQAVLEAGLPFGIFPEGTRSLSMKIERVLPGAGLFASGGNYPIVPCAITGSERLPFNGAKGHQKGSSLPDPGHKGVLVQFGEPFWLPNQIDGKRVNAAAATDYMMQKVAEMLPPAYRGIYGDEAKNV